MSGALDRALAAIDAGLQSSSERGYGTDHRPGQCARCQCRPFVEGGDLCAPCRLWLLGDSDRDPLHLMTDAELAAVVEAFRVFAQQVMDRLAAVALAAVAEAVVQVAEVLAPLMKQLEVVQSERECPRGHGPMPGGLCRKCARPGTWLLPLSAYTSDRLGRIGSPRVPSQTVRRLL